MHNQRINYTFGEDGLVRIELTAYDKRHKMTGRASRKCWKGKKVSEIVKDIADKHGFDTAIEVEDDVLYEFLSEGAKNDLKFLKELAEDAGCSVWVEGEKLYFKPNKVQEPVYKFTYYKDRDGYLRSFRITSKAESGKGTGRGTVASGIDPLTKKSISETVVAGEK